MHNIYTAYAINYIEDLSVLVMSYTSDPKDDFKFQVQTIEDIQMSINDEDEYLLKDQVQIKLRWRHGGEYTNLKYLATKDYLYSFVGTPEKCLFLVVRHVITANVSSQPMRNALISWAKTILLPQGGKFHDGWKSQYESKHGPLYSSPHHSDKTYISEYEPVMQHTDYASGGFVAYGGKEFVGSKTAKGNYYVANKSKQLPAMDAMVVMPCRDICRALVKTTTLRDAIMHLNDECKWSREKIADWLDDLHDTGQINIEFDPWKEEE